MEHHKEPACKIDVTYMPNKKLPGYRDSVPFSCFGGFVVSWMRYSVNLPLMKAGRSGSTITLQGWTRWDECTGGPHKIQVDSLPACPGESTDPKYNKEHTK